MNTAQLVKACNIRKEYILPMQTMQVKVGCKKEFCVQKCGQNVVNRGDCDCHNNV